MKKRSKAASKPAKARPRNALKRKGRSAAKALSDLRVATARETDVARLTRELNEARASIVLPNQKNKQNNQNRPPNSPCKAFERVVLSHKPA
jgi:hypothetical protein